MNNVINITTAIRSYDAVHTAPQMIAWLYRQVDSLHAEAADCMARFSIMNVRQHGAEMVQTAALHERLRLHVKDIYTYIENLANDAINTNPRNLEQIILVMNR